MSAWITSQTAPDAVVAVGQPWPLTFFTRRPSVLIPLNLEDEDLLSFQLWIMADRKGIAPRWGEKQFPRDGRVGHFVVLASGRDEAEDEGALRINSDARVLGATIRAGESASYRLDAHWLFRLNIDNLFDDADYISVGGGRISGTGLTTQPGINARFSATYSF